MRIIDVFIGYIYPEHIHDVQVVKNVNVDGLMVILSVTKLQFL